MRRPQHTSGRPQLRLVPCHQGPTGGRRRPERTNGRSRHAAPARDDKIVLARRRMEQGYYDRADVLERIAEGVLRYLRPASEPKSP